MDRNEAKAAIEAILFMMGDSVEISKLSDAIGTEKNVIRGLIDEMQIDYEKEDRGIYIKHFDNAVQLCTKEQMYEYMMKAALVPKMPTMSESLLETLSIVAYKQPVTRVEIEKIRGVSSDHAVSKLVEYGLVEERGRMDAPGRPLLFGTTEQFLRFFGVGKIEELPKIEPMMLEEFKLEAQEELQLQLEI
ncbi:MAG: SMC-Scp complex subunit ScpB [Lachnospiraceae bacterium]|jgi:segregation and condensation protein B|nr:SMC-Scp complex subunit ScpB [Lachnospiraceae bacterium]